MVVSKTSIEDPAGKCAADIRLSSHLAYLATTTQFKSRKMKPLVKNDFMLERFPGKGGWTYARIPEVVQNKNNAFGWVKVKGSIDGFQISKCHLMPMGNGKLFLPVRAEIRKAIRKNAGDTVRVILYPDNEPLQIPSEFLECLNDEPGALRFFKKLSEGEQNYYIKWIYSSKKEHTKISRMAESINRLAKELRFYDKH
jgi:hypothetical protein